MFKQIDTTTALQLAGEGKEVKVLVPSTADMGWKDFMPETLQGILKGCLFFQDETEETEDK